MMLLLMLLATLGMASADLRLIAVAPVGSPDVPMRGMLVVVLCFRPFFFFGFPRAGPPRASVRWHAINAALVVRSTRLAHTPLPHPACAVALSDPHFPSAMRRMMMEAMAMEAQMEREMEHEMARALPVTQRRRDAPASNGDKDMVIVRPMGPMPMPMPMPMPVDRPYGPDVPHMPVDPVLRPTLRPLMPIHPGPGVTVQLPRPTTDQPRPHTDYAPPTNTPLMVRYAAVMPKRDGAAYRIDVPVHNAPATPFFTLTLDLAPGAPVEYFRVAFPNGVMTSWHRVPQPSYGPMHIVLHAGAVEARDPIYEGIFKGSTAGFTVLFAVAHSRRGMGPVHVTLAAESFRSVSPMLSAPRVDTTVPILTPVPPPSQFHHGHIVGGSIMGILMLFFIVFLVISIVVRIVHCCRHRRERRRQEAEDAETAAALAAVEEYEMQQHAVAPVPQQQPVCAPPSYVQAVSMYPAAPQQFYAPVQPYYVQPQQQQHPHHPSFVLVPPPPGPAPMRKF